MDSSDMSEIIVMINGLPGNMGKEVASSCLRKGLSLAPFALTGAMEEQKEIKIQDIKDETKYYTVNLLKEDDSYLDEKISEMKEKYGDNLICVDYTHPDAVNSNAMLYSKHRLNFVMGTTGGDREKLLSDTVSGGLYAVIAMNMGKQIVALQRAIEYMAQNYPGSFSDFDLSITESHQSSKADTSGTAKALGRDFSILTGSSFDSEKEIAKIRDREGQLAFGVPEEHLGGHAFHTYTLRSRDGTIQFQFQHNVCGRRMYADGTVDAVKFLHRQIRNGATKRIYNMIDILEMGGL